jgi:hypothetical protein
MGRAKRLATYCYVTDEELCLLLPIALASASKDSGGYLAKHEKRLRYRTHLNIVIATWTQ